MLNTSGLLYLSARAVSAAGNLLAVAIFSRLAGPAEYGHYVLIFAWCSLLIVGYVMNGVLLSREWFWAAAVMLASLIAAFLAGFLTRNPTFYWFAGYGIPVAILLAGVLGRRNARSDARSRIVPA